LSELEFTGERVIPGLVDPNLLNEHLARYRFARLFAENGRVLDAGCGSGYGTAELATTASSVVAMDISCEAVTHARAAFTDPRTRFVQGSCERLPFADGSFDLIAAFEVIEHLEGWRDLLSEARRVLCPSGVLLVSTPNKAFYAESRADAGPNPFHVHEFEYREFETALTAVFPHVHLWSQNHCEVISLVSSEPSAGILDAAPDQAPEQAHFFLAACSQSRIPLPTAFAWMPSSGNVLRERQHHIALLETEVARKNLWIAEEQASHAALQTSHDALELELRTSNDWAASLDRELKTSGGVIGGLRHELNAARREYQIQIERLEAEAAARLQWVESLHSQIARGDAEILRLQTEIAARTDWAHSLDRDLRSERAVFRDLQEQHRQTAEYLAQTREELVRTQAMLQLLESTKWVRFGRGLHVMRDKPGDPAE
jgi:SAM-dependent methyltransferase